MRKSYRCVIVCACVSVLDEAVLAILGKRGRAAGQLHAACVTCWGCYNACVGTALRRQVPAAGLVDEELQLPLKAKDSLEATFCAASLCRWCGVPVQCPT